MYAGVGTGELGLGNEDIQENVFFYLSGPILGPLAFLVSLAVLTSSASSLQSTFVSPARTLLAMGHYGALPPKFAKVSPRFFTPGYATIVSAIVASVFYAVMRFVSEDVLWDTILTLGMMICFYYGITAFACVWYFRKQWFDSMRNFFFTFLFPLVGGVILAVLFVTTLIDTMDPDYGSGIEHRRPRHRVHPRHGDHRPRHRDHDLAGDQASRLLPRRDALAGCPRQPAPRAAADGRPHPSANRREP